MILFFIAIEGQLELLIENIRVNHDSNSFHFDVVKEAWDGTFHFDNWSFTINRTNERELGKCEIFVVDAHEYTYRAIGSNLSKAFNAAESVPDSQIFKVKHLQDLQYYIALYNIEREKERLFFATNYANDYDVRVLF